MRKTEEELAHETAEELATVERAVRDAIQANTFAPGAEPGGNWGRLRKLTRPPMTGSEAHELFESALRVIPASNEKFALLVLLNLLPSRSDLGVDARRATTLRALDVSYSTALRLEKAGLRQLIVVLHWLTLPGYSHRDYEGYDQWRPRLQEIEGKLYSIENDKMRMWPDGLDPKYYLPRQPTRTPESSL